MDQQLISEELIVRMATHPDMFQVVFGVDSTQQVIDFAKSNPYFVEPESANNHES